MEQYFTDEEITFTGLITEPSNADSVVAIWGYTDDSIWHTFVLNFTDLVKDECPLVLKCFKIFSDSILGNTIIQNYWNPNLFSITYNIF